MTVILLGAGNLAVHLGKRLYKKKIPVQQVFSRSFENAEALAHKIEAEPIASLKAVQPTASVYLIAVKDDAIPLVAQQLAAQEGLKDKLFAHTSGAVSSGVLAPYFKNYGVFYPLQTFSKQRKVAFKNIPICIEANTKQFKKKLKKMGERISNDVRYISDAERAVLHIAAVFANNFTNHLFYIAAEICKKEGLDFDVLKPLIEETVRKIADQAPYDMQTGPARRADMATINKHLSYLERYPVYANIYCLLSDSIRNTYQVKRNK